MWIANGVTTTFNNYSYSCWYEEANGTTTQENLMQSVRNPLVDSDVRRIVQNLCSHTFYNFCYAINHSKIFHPSLLDTILISKWFNFRINNASNKFKHVVFRDSIIRYFLNINVAYIFKIMNTFSFDRIISLYMKAHIIQTSYLARARWIIQMPFY